MKRIFFLAGELSGDQLGAWYIDKKYNQTVGDYYLEAVGGDALEQAGARLFARFEALNVVGVVEIVRHLPRLFSMMDKIVKHIVVNQFDELVLIDFPGFNLRVAKKIKKLQPSLKITYLSPPQLWCWGAWRLTSLKKYVDEVVVLYPFEVGWYKQRGLKVSWLGNPVFDRLQPYSHSDVSVGPIIAVLPGSRKKEIESLLPIMAAVIKNMHQQFPELSFVMPRPASLSTEFLMSHLDATGIADLVTLVHDDVSKYQLLKRSCMAITKPGTVTLELGLLGVPAVVMYKTSALTYGIGKMVVQVNHMALPNLLMPQPMYPEFIQAECTPSLITNAAIAMYQNVKNKSDVYQQQQQSLNALRELFSQEMIKN